MPEVDLFRYKLSEAEHERIFQEEIVPAWLADAVPQRDPVKWSWWAASPGPARRRLPKRSERSWTVAAAIHVCGDFYKPYHPQYARLLLEDDTTAGAYTRLDTRLWHDKAEAYARERSLTSSLRRRWPIRLASLKAPMPSAAQATESRR